MNAKTISLPWIKTEVKPEAGRGILVDGWNTRCPSYLEDCEVPEFAPLRLPSFNYNDVKYAVRIEITGRKGQLQPYDDRHWVRVKITFVGDGEPDTVSGGWMTV